MFRKHEEVDLDPNDAELDELDPESQKLVHAIESGELIPGYPGIGALPYLAVMGWPNERIYLMYDTGSQYYFYPVGTEMTGVNWEKVPAARPNRSQMDANKKAIIFNQSGISEPELRRGKSLVTKMTTCGFFSFKYENKLRKFIIMDNPGEAQITAFLSRLNVQYPDKSEKELRRDQDAQQLAEHGKELTQSQNPKTLKKGKIFSWILTGISVLIFYFGMYADSLYLLWILTDVCIFLLCLILCLAKPRYFSAVIGSRAEALEKYGANVVSLMLPMFVSGVFLALRVIVDVYWVSLVPIIIASVILCLVLSALLFFRCALPKKNVLIFLYCIFATAAASFGLLGQADWWLDSAVPVHQEECEVTYVWEDDYELEVDYQGHSIEITYFAEDDGMFAEGDTVTVYEYQGGLHIPFVDLY